MKPLVQSSKMMKALMLIVLCLNIAAYSQEPPFAKEWATYTNTESPETVGADINTDIAIDNNDNVYITKATNGMDETIALGSLSKFSPDGQLLWTTATYGETVGLAIDKNGDIVIAGYTNRVTGVATLGVFQENFGGGTTDAYLMKYNSEGEKIWGTYLGGSGNEGTNDNTAIYFTGLEITPDNDIIWSSGVKSEQMATNGTFQPQKNGAKFVISKFDPDGQRDWTTYYGTDQVQGYNIAGLKVNASGIFITGRVQSGTTTNTYFDTTGDYTFEPQAKEIYLSKFDYTGNRVWSRYIPKGDGQNYMKRYALNIVDNNIYLTYSTTSTDLGTTGTDFPSPAGENNPGILMKFDLQGNNIWSTYLPENDFGLELHNPSVYSDDDGEIYVLGNTLATDDGLLEGYSPEIEGSRSLYVMNFNDDGNLIWGNYFHDNDNDQLSTYGMAIYDQGLYFYAITAGSTNIATEGVFQENPNGEMFDSFIAKYTEKNLGLANNSTLSLKVYPNPTSNLLNLKINKGFQFPIRANFYNISGQCIISKKIYKTESLINLSSLSQGVYFLRLKMKDKIKTITKKIIVN